LLGQATNSKLAPSPPQLREQKVKVKNYNEDEAPPLVNARVLYCTGKYSTVHYITLHITVVRTSLLQTTTLKLFLFLFLFLFLSLHYISNLVLILILVLILVLVLGPFLYGTVRYCTALFLLVSVHNYIDESLGCSQTGTARYRSIKRKVPCENW